MEQCGFAVLDVYVGHPLEYEELVMGPLMIFPGITVLRMFRLFLAEVGLV